MLAMVGTPSVNETHIKHPHLPDQVDWVLNSDNAVAASSRVVRFGCENETTQKTPREKKKVKHKNKE